MKSDPLQDTSEQGRAILHESWREMPPLASLKTHVTAAETSIIHASRGVLTPDRPVRAARHANPENKDVAPAGSRINRLAIVRIPQVTRGEDVVNGGTSKAITAEILSLATVRPQQCPNADRRPLGQSERTLA